MNTILNFCLFVFCLGLNTSAWGQNPNIDKITAVKLTAEIGQAYFSKPSIKAFSVDKNNILRPATGFKISYFNAEKKIAIHPKTMKLTSSQPSVPGFDVSPVPGGTMFCLCDQREDNCKISPRVLDNTLIFECVGSCGCGSFIIYDTSDPVLEYESGGNWFRF